MTSHLGAADDIHEQAGLWLAQRRLLDPGEFDEAGFQAWMAADPRHAAAFADVSATADLVAGLQQLHPTQVRFRRPWVWAAAGMAAAAALLIAVVAAPMLAPPQARHATAVAEIETYTLPDGSVVTLAPVSQLEVRFSQGQRRVVLTAGEAFFDVASDQDRPFLVRAGDATLRVVGTKFDVRRGARAVRVTVAEGVVRVRASALVSFASSPPMLLEAGDQAEMAERAGWLAPPRPPVMSQVSPASAGAWRSGHLAYVEAPLADIVADLDRYYAPGVRLSDPSLGEIRLTASFRAADLDTFFSTLPAAAPVAVTRGTRGEVIIGPAR